MMHKPIGLGVDPWCHMMGREMPHVAEVVVPTCEGGVCEGSVCVKYV